MKFHSLLKNFLFSVNLIYILSHPVLHLLLNNYHNKNIWNRVLNTIVNLGCSFAIDLGFADIARVFKSVGR